MSKPTTTPTNEAQTSLAAFQPSREEQQMLDLLNAAEQATPEALERIPLYARPVRLARAMTTLENLLNERVIKEVFMPLQGKKLGFRTDRDDRGGYDWQVVRACVMEAILRGFMPVNNEFNIIAGGFYGAQAGFERKVRELPGIANVEHHPGVPNQKETGGNAAVPYRITYLHNGKACEYVREALKDEKGVIVRDGRIPVKANQGMGPDAIVGKARRKILAALYEKITGITVPDGEVLDTLGTEVAERKSVAAATQDMLLKHADRTAARNGNGDAANARPVINADGEVAEGGSSS